MSKIDSPTDKPTVYRFGSTSSVFKVIEKAAEQCKLFSDSRACIIPQDGYIALHSEMDLGYLIRESTIKEDEYDDIPQEIKDYYLTVTSNTGKRYLIPCPRSCNSIKIYF